MLYQWQFQKSYSKMSFYLLGVRVEESAVWGLEFTLAYVDSTVHATWQCSVLLWGAEPERINSIGVLEELSTCWIFLDVFPTGVRPSAWYQLKVLLWHSSSGFVKTVVSITTRSHWPASGLIATTIVQYVISSSFLLHCWFYGSILFI